MTSRGRRRGSRRGGRRWRRAAFTFPHPGSRRPGCGGVVGGGGAVRAVIRSAGHYCYGEGTDTERGRDRPRSPRHSPRLPSSRVGARPLPRVFSVRWPPGPARSRRDEEPARRPPPPHIVRVSNPIRRRPAPASATARVRGDERKRARESEREAVGMASPCCCSGGGGGSEEARPATLRTPSRIVRARARAHVRAGACVLV